MRKRKARPSTTEPPLSRRKGQSTRRETYSLKTNTFFWPAKRTSRTWPFSPTRIEVYSDLVSRSSQRPSDSAIVFFALLHGGLVAIDRELIFAGLQRSLAELGGLRKTDGLSKRFCKNRHYHC